MMVLRTLEGAEKCAFRLFRRLECKLVLIFVILPGRGSGMRRCRRRRCELELSAGSSNLVLAGRSVAGPPDASSTSLPRRLRSHSTFMGRDS